MGMREAGTRRPRLPRWRRSLDPPRQEEGQNWRRRKGARGDGGPDAVAVGEEGRKRDPESRPDRPEIAAPDGRGRLTELAGDEIGEKHDRQLPKERRAHDVLGSPKRAGAEPGRRLTKRRRVRHRNPSPIGLSPCAHRSPQNRTIQPMRRIRIPCRVHELDQSNSVDYDREVLLAVKGVWSSP